MFYNQIRYLHFTENVTNRKKFVYKSYKVHESLDMQIGMSYFLCKKISIRGESKIFHIKSRILLTC